MLYNKTMKILKENQLDVLVEILNDGGIIAFPTDTVYGLGCRYDSKEAIDKIKQAKLRDASKPLPMMCASIEEMKKVAFLSDDALKVAHAFMPGALTMVLKKNKELILDYITNGLDTIGIRIPDDPFVLGLLQRLGCPMLVTSANLSNQPSLYQGSDVIACLGPTLDAIVLGTAPGKVASTLVDMSEDMKILREGPITKEKIEEALK